MLHYHITLKSSNVKTGKIPVTTSDSLTCPDSCPLKASNTCYAKSGNLNLHWSKVSDGSRAISFDQLIETIRQLPVNQLWRHNQAGDLMGLNETIDVNAMHQLIDANRGKRGFTYTHKPLNAENSAIIKESNQKGFTVNVSANNLIQADEYKALNIAPVVAIISDNLPKTFKTAGGNRVVTCPAQTNSKTSCETCGLCQRADRDYIIGFIAHGTSKKRLLSQIGG